MRSPVSAEFGAPANFFNANNAAQLTVTAAGHGIFARYQR